MRTKEYINKFGLNNVDLKDENFDKDGFVKDFIKEFKERLNITLMACQKMQVEFNYHKFQILVKEMNTKFKAINAKKASMGELDESIFNKFFAVGVIPLRKKMFPLEHNEATMAREKKTALEPKVIKKK